MNKSDSYWVKDRSLAESGKRRIAWAERHMPVCMAIRRKFYDSKPLRGVRISACLHVTKETAVLIRALIAGGAEVSLSASNPLSTQDDVAAALVEEGVAVYAFRGQDVRQYYECIANAIRSRPNITIDDGADLTTLIHRIYHGIGGDEIRYASSVLGDGKEYLSEIKGGTEETTTGVIRLRALEREGLLIYPIIAVNEAHTKRLFDNPIGTGQSAMDGILRATGILIAGKRVVVVGYGQVGSGIAKRARGLGAQVIVVEANPIRALMAAMDGYEVTNMARASRVGDLFITATGDINVIRREHLEVMKDGAILANAGHYDVEISKRDLLAISERVEEVSPLITKYVLRDGRELYLLAGGRLVNLVAAEGHPSEVMDLSFALQALSVEYIARSHVLEKRVHDVPEEIDREVALAKLRSMSLEIEELTEEQKRYLADWKVGT